MRWLRRFFYSDDPVVKLVAAVTEPEAEMRRELLANEGIVAMVKNKSGLSYMWGSGALPFENSHDLFVKQSDLERAEEILGAFDLAEGDEHEDIGGWHSNPKT